MRPVVWLSETAWADLHLEATAMSPQETGGVLMGWWCGPKEAVVDRVIGPGPAAEHEATRFRPDHHWQVGEIARVYAAHDRQVSYLGDWHSHPGEQMPHLSGADRRVLRRIARTPSARAPSPLMLILFGFGVNWQAAAWMGIERRLLGVSMFGAKRATVRRYGSAKSSNPLQADPEQASRSYA